MIEQDTVPVRRPSESVRTTGREYLGRTVKRPATSTLRWLRAFLRVLSGGIRHSPGYAALVAIPVAFSLGVGEGYGLPNLFWDGDYEHRQVLIGMALASFALLACGLAVVEHPNLSRWVDDADEVLGVVGRLRPRVAGPDRLDGLWRIWLALWMPFGFALICLAIEKSPSTMTGLFLPAGAWLTVLAACGLAAWLAARPRAAGRAAWPMTLLLASLLVASHVLVLKWPGLAHYLSAVGALCLVLSEFALLLHFTSGRPLVRVALILALGSWVHWSNSSPYKLTIPGFARYYALDKVGEVGTIRGRADDREDLGRKAEAVRLDPPDKQKRMEYARALLRAGNLDPASKLAEFEAAKLRFGDDDVPRIFEELLRLEGLGIGVKSLLASPAGPDPDPQSDAKPGDARGTEAFTQALGALGDMAVMDFDGAREKFDRALANDPKNSLYYYFRALATAGMGNPRIAAKDLREVRLLKGHLSPAFLDCIGVARRIEDFLKGSPPLAGPGLDDLTAKIKQVLMATFTVHDYGGLLVDVELELIEESIQNRMYGLAAMDSRRTAEELKEAAAHDDLGWSRAEGAPSPKDLGDLAEAIGTLHEIIRRSAVGGMGNEGTAKLLKQLEGWLVGHREARAKGLGATFDRIERIGRHVRGMTPVARARHRREAGPEASSWNKAIQILESTARADRDDPLPFFGLAEALRSRDSGQAKRLSGAVDSARVRLERTRVRRQHEIAGKFREEVVSLPRLLRLDDKDSWREAIRQLALAKVPSGLQPDAARGITPMAIAGSILIAEAIKKDFDQAFTANLKAVADWRRSFQERGGPDGLVFQALEPVDDLQALENWLESARARGPAGAKDPVLVVVATSGGGIAAAVWTASCLTEIERLHPDFPYHIRLVTGASGGMVGAGPYVASLGVPGPREAERRRELIRDKALVNAVSEDSLTPTIRRTLLADLPSILCPRNQSNDRGRVLEDEWEKSWSSNRLGLAEGLKLHDLAGGERDGWRPSLVISPTIVEETHFLLISNLDFAGLKGDSQFFRLYPASRKELSLATALRLNASFPLISPAASLPEVPGERSAGGITVPMRRVVDAGFLDNFGVELACSWIEHRKSWLYTHTSGVLLLRLEAFDNTPELAPKAGGGPASRSVDFIGSWVETLWGTYRKTMTERNKERIAELRRWFNETYEWQTAPEGPGRPEFFQEIVLSPASKKTVPLGWRLSKADRKNVELSSYHPGDAKSDEKSRVLARRVGQVLQFLGPDHAPASP